MFVGGEPCNITKKESGTIICNPPNIAKEQAEEIKEVTVSLLELGTLIELRFSRGCMAGISSSVMHFIPFYGGSGRTSLTCHCACFTWLVINYLLPGLTVHRVLNY